MSPMNWGRRNRSNSSFLSSPYHLVPTPYRTADTCMWKNDHRNTESFRSHHYNVHSTFCFFSWVWRSVHTKFLPVLFASASKSFYINGDANIDPVSLYQNLWCKRLLWREPYGLFTVPNTKTETDADTDKMDTEPNGNLRRSPSLSSVNTSTQFYTSHFLLASLSRCLGV